MGKSAFEQIGGTYYQQGDYFLPNLTVPESVPIGIWGQRRRRYLQEHRNSIYIALFLSSKLDTHLAEIDHQAEEMFFQLVVQMASQDGISEQLKADYQMEWVGNMNNICNRAAEIVNTEIIFA